MLLLGLPPRPTLANCVPLQMKPLRAGMCVMCLCIVMCVCIYRRHTHSRLQEQAVILPLFLSSPFLRPYIHSYTYTYIYTHTHHHHNNNNSELDKAIKLLSQAIQLEPENEKNHYKRYRAHLRGKKYREALQDLSTSLTLDPENGAKLQQRAKYV